MQLKRYVLLSDNRVVDTSKTTFGIIENVLYEEIKRNIQWELQKYGNVIATSDDVFDLVRKGDCFELFDEIEQVKNDNGYFGAINGYSYNIKDYKDNIIRIYKWQEKDLICVWEREEKE